MLQIAPQVEVWRGKVGTYSTMEGGIYIYIYNVTHIHTHVYIYTLCAHIRYSISDGFWLFETSATQREDAVAIFFRFLALKAFQNSRFTCQGGWKPRNHWNHHIELTWNHVPKELRPRVSEFCSQLCLTWASCYSECSDGSRKNVSQKRLRESCISLCAVALPSHRRRCIMREHPLVISCGGAQKWWVTPSAGNQIFYFIT